MESESSAIFEVIMIKLSKAESLIEQIGIIQTELSIIKDPDIKKQIEVYISVLLAGNADDEKIVILIHGIRDQAVCKKKSKLSYMKIRM